MKKHRIGRLLRDVPIEVILLQVHDCPVNQTLTFRCVQSGCPLARFAYRILRPWLQDQWRACTMGN